MVLLIMTYVIGVGIMRLVNIPSITIVCLI